MYSCIYINKKLIYCHDNLMVHWLTNDKNTHTRTLKPRENTNMIYCFLFTYKQYICILHWTKTVNIIKKDTYHRETKSTSDKFIVSNKQKHSLRRWGKQPQYGKVRTENKRYVESGGQFFIDSDCTSITLHSAFCFVSRYTIVDNTKVWLL